MTHRVIQIANAVFGKMAGRSVTNYPELERQFLRARLLTHPQAYLSLVYFLVAVSLALGFVVGLALVLTWGDRMGGRGILAVLLMGPMVAILVYLFMMMYPELKIQGRARKIDANLPYALNFISAMTSAGVIPHAAFGALSRQEAYGEVAQEARWIFRDVTLLGKDIVTALMEASRRSASRQFTEFLQGTVSTVNSGGDMHEYFLQRAAHAAERQRRTERSYIESLGVIAESYVVVAVAGPLFLIIIISVLTLISARVADPIFFLNIIIFLLLPVIHMMFANLVKGMKPEA